MFDRPKAFLLFKSNRADDLVCLQLFSCCILDTSCIPPQASFIGYEFFPSFPVSIKSKSFSPSPRHCPDVLFELRSVVNLVGESNKTRSRT